MIESLRIQGYRCFEDFTLEGLGRVNLLVGRNNGGKSSVLEAVGILGTKADPAFLRRIGLERGETAPPLALESLQNAAGRTQSDRFYIGSLFRNHVTLNSSILVSAGEKRPESVSLEFADEGDLLFKVTSTPIDYGYTFSASEPGFLDWKPSGRVPRRKSWTGPAVQFIGSNSTSSSSLTSMWGAIALTPMEDMVMEAVRYIDPQIERIAVMPEGAPVGALRGGFVARHNAFESRISVGSLGEGFWRLLALSIGLAQCRGGILLVDEIEGGLHYSVLLKMWQFILHVAMEFDVQVFATTHSSDCISALAQIAGSSDANNRIALHRIDARKKKSVNYSAGELAAAAEIGVEVR